VARLYVNKTNALIYQNSVQVGTFTPTGKIEPNRFYIGSSYDNLIDNPESFISEIIIFDRAINESERIDVENYLYQKWGLNLN